MDTKLDKKPGLLGIRLRYWFTVAGLTGGVAMLANTVEPTLTVDPAMVRCVVSLDPELGVKEASVQNNNKDKLYVFDQGTDVLASKWTGEALQMRFNERNQKHLTTVGDFYVHTKDGQPIACEVDGEVYAVGNSLKF